MMTSVYRVALILHKTPMEAMKLTGEEIRGIWEEHIDMTTETITGKRKPRLYEYERIAIDDMKKRFNDGS